MAVIEMLAAVLFVLSSGVLFNERFRRNRYLVGLAGCLALVSTYLLFQYLFGSRFPTNPARSGSPSLSRADFGPASVWVPPGSHNLHIEASNCQEFECFEKTMKANSASDDATHFSRSYSIATGAMGYMAKFSESGKVDLAEVIEPGLMNEQMGFVFVNGDPEIIKLDAHNSQESLRQLAGTLRAHPQFHEIAARHPNARPWAIVEMGPSHWRADGGQTIPVVWDMRECRACEIVGRARVEYRFTREGILESATVTSVGIG
jgi:hypothetical protein